MHLAFVDVCEKTGPSKELTELKCFAIIRCNPATSHKVSDHVKLQSEVVDCIKVANTLLNQQLQHSKPLALTSAHKVCTRSCVARWLSSYCNV